MSNTPSLEITMEMDDDFLDKMEDAFEKSIIDEGMKLFAEKVKKVWTEKAEQTLHNSKKEYLKGLEVEQIGETVKVTLSGQLAIAIEQGTKFDMKPGLLAGKTSRLIGSDAFDKPNAAGKITHVRTVTNDPKQMNMWWYPESQGAKIAEQVEAELPTINQEVFNALIARIKV